ncbi:hypothetical protein GP486_003031 [Trichoglossum hirsutum]|uniref:Uncharacterized protein n=1 Tax=Trichoglossum hirsutum TaxID=265104 RepID=A0A9P8LE37_9PEZI|nr:hypothetical protein GP486_003031 [Trichoglossum hirsutum]
MKTLTRRVLSFLLVAALLLLQPAEAHRRPQGDDDDDYGDRDVGHRLSRHRHKSKHIPKIETITVELSIVLPGPPQPTVSASSPDCTSNRDDNGGNLPPPPLQPQRQFHLNTPVDFSPTYIIIHLIYQSHFIFRIDFQLHPTKIHPRSRPWFCPYTRSHYHTYDYIHHAFKQHFWRLHLWKSRPVHVLHGPTTASLTLIPVVAHDIYEHTNAFSTHESTVPHAHRLGISLVLFSNESIFIDKFFNGAAYLVQSPDKPAIFVQPFEPHTTKFRRSFPFRGTSSFYFQHQYS